MATYYKPQSPIQSGEDFIYPITTADQIMKSDNSRLEQNGEIVADNSPKLGGIAASEYALKTKTVPTSRTVNGKALSENITLSASEVGARPDTWMPSASDVGALAQGGTAANASKLGGKTWANLMLEIYPVGSIYMSVSSTSPASLFGGTWTALEGRFLIGANSTYSAGSTGGAATRTLTGAQMPKHRHTGLYANGDYNYEFPYGAANQSVSSKLGPYTTGGSGGSHHWVTGYEGSGSAFDTIPPYLAVYMWKRVS